LAFSLGAPVGGYSGSALRFGLVDIRPIEVSETVKRFGLKFRRVTRKFQSLEPSNSYADLVTFENEAIFNTIDVPEWFNADELVTIFSQRSVERYEKDTDLKKAVEEIRKATRKGKPLLSFIQYFRNRVESEREHYIEIEADRFLRSSFPLSFYNKLVVFDNTFFNFLEALEDIVRLYESRASYSRNFLMYRRKIAEMQRYIAPMIDDVDKCNFFYSRLKKYVSIWNSKDYKEVFNPEFLDFKKVDLAGYENLYNICSEKLSETRELLLRYKSQGFRKELDSEESTRNMFGKLVMVPSGYLRL